MFFHTFALTMKRLRFSLATRLHLFISLPVIIALAAMGIFSFYYQTKIALLLLWLLLSILILTLVLLFYRRIVKPIKQLKEAAIEVGKANFNIQLNANGFDEIGELNEAFNKMVLQLRQLSEEFNSEHYNELQSVIDGQEMERQRLSRELHDGLGQLLIAMKLKLESINHTDMSKIRYMISHIKDLFDKTIDEIRRISNDLMPTVLNEFGLEKAMRRLCEEISEYAKIKIEYTYKGEFESIGKRAKMYLYRITQEALNNIYKYAEASQANVNLLCNENNITLEIIDNGKGFTFESQQFKGGNGLRNMSERTNLLGGLIEIKTSTGKGTHIHIEIPLSAD